MPFRSLVFLISLPFGVVRPEKLGPGHDTGAPDKPFILKKIIVTTVLSAVLWLGVDWVISAEIISFRELSHQL